MENKTTIDANVIAVVGQHLSLLLHYYESKIHEYKVKGLGKTADALRLLQEEMVCDLKFVMNIRKLSRSVIIIDDVGSRIRNIISKYDISLPGGIADDSSSDGSK